MRCTGAWGGADVELRGTGGPMGSLDGFRDRDDAALILTHPLAGYFRRTDERVGGYDVWHDGLRPELGVASVRGARSSSGSGWWRPARGRTRSCSSARRSPTCCCRHAWSAETGRVPLRGDV